MYLIDLFESAKTDLLYSKIAIKFFVNIVDNFDKYFERMIDKEENVQFVYFGAYKPELSKKVYNDVNLDIDYEYFILNIFLTFYNPDKKELSRKEPRITNDGDLYNIIIPIPVESDGKSLNEINTNKFAIAFSKYKSVFIHEYTHFIDLKIRGAKKTQNILTSQSSNFNYQKYINTPIEFNAFFMENLENSLVSLIENKEHRNEAFHEYNPRRFIEILFEYFDFETLYNLYNDENKRKMIKRLTSIYNYVFDKIKNYSNEKSLTISAHKALRDIFS